MHVKLLGRSIETEENKDMIVADGGVKMDSELSLLDKKILFLISCGRDTFASLHRMFEDYKPNEPHNEVLTLDFSLTKQQLFKGKRGIPKNIKRILNMAKKEGEFVIWKCLTTEIVDIFARLEQKKYIRFRPSSLFVYVYDGGFLSDKNWLPTLITLTDKGRSAIENVRRSRLIPNKCFLDDDVKLTIAENGFNKQGKRKT